MLNSCNGNIWILTYALSCYKSLDTNRVKRLKGKAIVLEINQLCPKSGSLIQAGCNATPRGISVEGYVIPEDNYPNTTSYAAEGGGGGIGGLLLVKQ